MSKSEKGDNSGDPDPSSGKMQLPSVLTYEEMDRCHSLIDDLDDLIAFRLMLYGGLRVDEVINLKVKHISRERGGVFVEEGKSGDGWAPVDLATISMAHCRAKDLGLAEDDQLYPRAKRTLQHRMTQLFQRAGVGWATCHTLRHSCATWQLDQGLPLETVRANLRHSDIKTTQLYLHLNIRQRSRAYRDATRFGV